jgi:hypothetical protein
LKTELELGVFSDLFHLEGMRISDLIAAEGLEDAYSNRIIRVKSDLTTKNR